MLYSEFHTILHTPSHNFMQYSRNFTQFWLFHPFLGQLQHVGYLNASTPAEKFDGDTFTQFHAISRTCHAIFRQFKLFRPFLGQLQHVGYLKAYARTEKFISNIGRGHRPQEGEPQRHGQRPPNGATSPLQPSTGARIKGAWTPLSSSFRGNAYAIT